MHFNVRHMASVNVSGPPGCHVSITADRSWSRELPVTTAVSFVPGMNPVTFPAEDKSQMLVGGR